MSDIDVDELVGAAWRVPEPRTPTPTVWVGSLTDDDVRQSYAYYNDQDEAPEVDFDTWLAKHDADLREQIAREIAAERTFLMGHGWHPGSQYIIGLADAAGVVRRNGASA